MNIESEYLALVSAIQKDWKDETTNLAETVLQIIRHFEFMEGTEKDKSVLQTSTSRPTLTAPKGSCKNLECIEKGLTTHYTDRCWIKHPELRQKYALGRMRTRGSQQNLKAEESKDVKTEPTPERESWQPRILAVRGPKESCWLVNSAADVHVCNDKRLMTNFMENPTKVGRSTSNGISPGRGKVKIRLALQDRTEGLVLTLTNVFYLLFSPSNLISLGLLNNAGIFYHNEDQTLYNLETRKTLAFAKQYKTSFLLHPLNLSAAAVSLLRNNNIYKERNVHQTQDKKLPLTRWHQRLGHLNFAALKRHLAHHNIAYTDDAERYVCDSCEKTKATKQYNCTPQQRATKPYQFIHTDLVGPITPIGFGGERYFFTFTNDYTRITETYTAKRKSEWLKCLKAF